MKLEDFKVGRIYRYQPTETKYYIFKLLEIDNNSIKVEYIKVYPNSNSDTCFDIYSLDRYFPDSMYQIHEDFNNWL